MINLNIQDVPKELQAGLEAAAEELGVVLSNKGIPVIVSEAADGLTVTMEQNKAFIAYSEKVQLFRGIGLLTEAVQKETPVFHLQEKPKFHMCGIMFDCSRNAVMKVSTVKYFLRKMAVMGLNAFLLYLEDTYEVKDEPYFGYLRGRYTGEELKEIDDYACSLGIEVIPCIQTLAHLEQYLKWPAAEKHRDTDSILMAGEDSTYEFIRKCIESVTSPLRSRRIHIGMDEAHMLGLGRYLDKNGYHTRFEIMTEHIRRVMKITNELGLKPMMWGDMFFRMFNDGGYYNPDIQIPDEVAGHIPKGMELVYWDYYHHDREFYLNYIRRHKKFGSMPVFGGGICTWTGAMVQNYVQTIEATQAGLSACKQEGVQDVFATVWNDNGSECSALSVLPGMVLYAEHMYQAEPTENDLKDKIKFYTGMPEAAWKDLCSIDRLDTEEDPIEPQNPSKYLLWQDPLLGIFDKHTLQYNLEAHYDRIDCLLTIWRENAMPKPLDELFEQIQVLCRVLEKKCRLGVMMKIAYDEGNRKLLEEIVWEWIPEIQEQLRKLYRLHRHAWFQMNKPFGWEILDIRYGGLTARLASVRERLLEYLDGKTDRIEELEPERLTYDGRDTVENGWLGGANLYRYIATPNDLG